MISFPFPLEGELILSLLSRAAAYYGSQNILLGLMKTQTSGMICDGKDLIAVAEILASSGYTAEYLFFKHTIYPLWLPFSKNSKKCKNIISKNNLHEILFLRKGIASVAYFSRMILYAGIFIMKRYWYSESGSYMKFCPKCVEEQYKKYKLCYWRREYQDIIVDICPFHGCILKKSSVNISHKLRENCFLPLLTEEIIDQGITGKKSDVSCQIADAVMDLFSHSSYSIPSMFQWYTYYTQLISKINKKYNSIDDIVEKMRNKWKILSTFNSLYLKQNKVLVISSSPYWLIHYAFLDTISPSTKLSEAIEEAANLPQDTNNFDKIKISIR